MGPRLDRPGSVGCAGSAIGGSAAAGVARGCEVGAPLAGAAYDVTKSRFAFGSTPSEEDAYGFYVAPGTSHMETI